MDARIRRELLPEHRAAAAALYAGAFERYFAFAPQLRARLPEMLAAAIDPRCAVSAVAPDGRLLAVMGLNLDGRRFVDLRLGLLVRRLGLVRGLLNGLGVAWMDRPHKRGQLLLDGIVTADAARGFGLGSRLLAEAAAMAGERSLRSIRLDVVDGNDGARRLYRRMSFAEVGHSRLPAFMAARLGFGGATTMLKVLA